MFFRRICTTFLIASYAFLPIVHSQFYFDFSEDDLDGWVGDTQDFRINPVGQLQLNAQVPGIATLLHPVAFTTDTIIWQGYFHLDFPPSNTNNLIYYLYLADTLGMGPAIFLEVGENGGEDALRLVFVDTVGQRSSYLLGEPSSMAQSPAKARWWLTGFNNGRWTFNVSYSKGEAPTFEKEIVHATQSWPQTGFIGPSCSFTTTRKDRFYFDDLYAGQVVPDTIPPTLDSLITLDSQSIRLLFSEPIRKQALQDESNFEILDGPIISGTVFDTLMPLSIVLKLASPLEHTWDYSLILLNLFDLAGNRVEKTEYSFEYYRYKDVLPYDIVFTEIMADPSPALLLPEAEYLEVVNRSSEAIAAQGWLLQVDDEIVSLPNRDLKPGEYLIICDPENSQSFKPFGHTWLPDKLPTLKNSQARIFLFDSSLELLDQLYYKSDQHSVQGKSDGGWSLELTSEDEPCFPENWQTSTDPAGGSPGRSNTDPEVPSGASLNVSPKIYPVNSNTLVLSFHSKVLPPDSGIYPFEIIPPLDVDALGIEENGTSTWTIFLKQPLDSTVLYNLTWPRPLKLCNERFITPSDKFFGLPRLPKIGDLLINEILFDPIDDGVDYIELKHVGDHPIDLSQLMLRRTCMGYFEQVLFQSQRLLLPGEYVCLTTDPADVKAQYPYHDPRTMIDQELPAMNNGSGCLSLIVQQHEKFFLLDSIYYEDDYHHPLLEDVEGVSLERTGEIGFAFKDDHWSSATASVMYGTPGRKNSHYVELPDHSNWYKPISGTFSPDGDGFEDLYRVSIRSPYPAGVLFAAIMNLNGQTLRIIEDNILVGSEHLVTWDGAATNDQHALPGPYILHLRLLYPNGTILQAKMISVLAMTAR